MGKEKLITQIKISLSLAASDCASVVFIIHKQKKTQTFQLRKAAKNPELRLKNLTSKMNDCFRFF